MTIDPLGCLGRSALAAVNFESQRRQTVVGVAAVLLGVVTWWLLGVLSIESVGAGALSVTVLRYCSIAGWYLALGYAVNCTRLVPDREG